MPGKKLGGNCSCGGGKGMSSLAVGGKKRRSRSTGGKKYRSKSK